MKKAAVRTQRLTLDPEKQAYLILVSLNSTCLRAIGSYFVLTIFSVMVRLFFFVT